MGSAVKLMDWYVNEALRVQSGRTDPRSVARPSAARMAAGKSGRRPAPRTVPFRDILRFGPNCVRTKSAADKAIRILVEHEWIEDRTDPPRIIRIPRGD